MRSPLLLLLLPAAPSASAFYIPGWSVRSYAPSEPIPLLVNKVYSDNTQLQFPYADLPFVCSHGQAAQQTAENVPKPDADAGNAAPRPPSRAQRLAALLGGKPIPLSLGEVLRGDRITTSDMALAMGEDAPCNVLCRARLPAAAAARARDLIGKGYVAEWIVDNLPGATKFVTADRTKKYYSAGFKLGYVDYSSPEGPPRYFLHNHHAIVLLVRDAPGRVVGGGGGGGGGKEDGGKPAKVIVGFEVYPKSIAAAEKRNPDGCPDLKTIKQGFELAPDGDQADDLVIPYTYSVHFVEDESIEWHHRWDLYFVGQQDGARTHWLAIVNSLVICGVLSGIVAVILARTVRADIKSYHELPEVKALRARRSAAAAAAAAVATATATATAGDGLLLGTEASGHDDDDYGEDEFADALEDVTGWKRLHADVFRPPPYGAALLAPVVGSGTQLLFMAFSLVVLGAVGVLNPSWRGGFVSVGVALFVLAGLLSGYFSARISRALGGSGGNDNTGYGANAFLTAALFPGLFFVTGFILNLFVWAQASSTAVPFTTLAALVLLWLCVQLPLVYAGAWYGRSRAGGHAHAARTSALARRVPPQPWYLRPAQSVLLAGLVPFAVILIELLFVLQSLWRDKSAYYYVFGYLAIVSAVLVVTVAEVTVVAVYAQLCAEDHRWWWRSFLAGGGSAVWVFAYCAWYYAFRLEVQGWVSGMLFFAYSAVACAAYGLLTGTVGFLSAYAFVRSIYREIKVD